MVCPISCAVDGAARGPGAEERSDLDHEPSYDALMRWEWEGGAPASAGEGWQGDGSER
jgi:hypothetical protein